MASPVAGDGALSRESIEAALAGVGDEALQERGARAAKSTAALKEVLTELELEQGDLREENKRLRTAIELLMGQLNKLNIGAANLAEPELDEGPMDFVGRFWEMMRPRETAMSVNDHIGEIKKPGAGPAEARVPLAEELSNVMGLFGHLGMAASRENAAATESAPAPDAVEKPDVGSWSLAAGQGPSVGSFFSYFMQPTVGCALGRSSAGPGLPEDDTLSGSTAALVPAVVVTGAAPRDQEGDAGAAVTMGGNSLREDDAEDLEPFDIHDFAGSAAATKADAKAVATEEQIESSILIEAWLTMDDGEVLPCRVRAADRCKDAAKRFVIENSLKAVFEAPLVAFLMKLENDAVKFPVQVNANLMEIRQEFSKVS